MEIKINVTSSEEDRKNVELFEFRRRKEEEFKHKIEEQMDSLISQNEKEKSRIKDEIRKLENKIDELDEENRKFEKMKESPYFEKDEFYKLGDTSKKIMTVTCLLWSRSTICSLVMNLLLKILNLNLS